MIMMPSELLSRISLPEITTSPVLGTVPAAGSRNFSSPSAARRVFDRDGRSRARAAGDQRDRAEMIGLRREQDAAVRPLASAIPRHARGGASPSIAKRSWTAMTLVIRLFRSCAATALMPRMAERNALSSGCSQPGCSCKPDASPS